MSTRKNTRTGPTADEDATRPPGKSTAKAKRSSRSVKASDTTTTLTEAGPTPRAGTDLYARARAAWEQGDWSFLAALTKHPLEAESERARLALLAAAGLAQTGQLEDMRRHIDQALNWGVSRQLAAQILTSGAFNTLGRFACLIEDDASAARYFENALLSAYSGHDVSNGASFRQICERAQLGLLPEAVTMLDGLLQTPAQQVRLTSPEAEIFHTQIELLSHMLSIAQRRGQLDPGQPDSDLERRATSQLGQELWVLEQTGHKHGGFFVEFGATDGVLLSNTYLLEKEFDWSGICAEPNPAFFEKLKKNRSCITTPDCIGPTTGTEVEFILADEYGGFSEFANSDNHAARRAAYRQKGQVIHLTTISLDDFLKSHNAPRKIDYLSIDTEGSEYAILSAFPFGEWDIRLLTVEHNNTPMREKIRVLLESQGYTRTERQWDDWYAKPEN